jgi:HD-GYP domain-containing protein (c-di-GMP phosphodiesterase class II)
MAGAVFADVAERTQERVDDLMTATLSFAELGAALPDVSAPPAADPLHHPGVAPMTRMLAIDPSLYSVFVGRDDGAFLQWIAVRGDPRIALRLQAPEGTVLVGRTVQPTSAGRVQNWVFLNASGETIGRRADADTDFDPRERFWFRDARPADAVTLSQPYIFHSSMTPGLTAARTAREGGAVFGADVTLDGLAAFVSALRVSEHGRLYVFDEEMTQLAPYPADDADARRNALLDLARQEGGEDTRIVDVEGVTCIADLAVWQGPGGRRIHIGVIAPVSDFAEQLDRLARHVLLVGLLVLVGMSPLIYLLSRSVARSVDGLASDADRIRRFDFSETADRSSFITEFDLLAEAFHLMRGSLRTRSRELALAQAKLERMLTLGIAMSAERDADRLLETIMVGAKEIAGAEGSTLFLRTDRDTLRFMIVHNDPLNLRLSSGDEVVGLADVPLFATDGAPNRANVVSVVVNEKRTIAIDDPYGSEGFDFSGPRAFDTCFNYRTRSILTVPLMPRGGEVVGALQLVNARDPDTGEPVPFSPGVRAFVEALAAQAAVALDNRNLLDALDRMVEGMTRMVAYAVDAKSPYTGAHCVRVPELAMMLAEAASRATQGPFADFAFTTPEQWREFRVGAWLHDCGKVTTPEFVIDKATKLETVVNRIHEVRTRFEVLSRDAEIARLQTVLLGGDVATADAMLAERQRQLREDFAFVAACNVGTESMADADIERLKRIAATTWMRTFSDRLGLSEGERIRLAGIPERPLPAEEHLLADRPEHVVPRTPDDPVANPDYAFNLKAPANRFNFGEVYNLSIRRGTLTEEERAIVNDHIVQTIVMLDNLKLPKDLRRVPEYAGTHHETLTGSGYPFGLTGAQLSIPARIMAVADIFEALTASDRPYKKAKTLSDAVNILADFARRRAIDPDVFRLFLESGVYRRYAERFLSPEQIDAVDEAACIASVEEAE